MLNLPIYVLTSILDISAGLFYSTDIERQETPDRLRYINLNTITHFAKQPPSLSKSRMLFVHEARKISYSYHLRC